MIEYNLTFPGNVEMNVSVDGSGGTISSNLEKDDAVNALESLILAHACAGINIAGTKYREGIETALEAIANND